MYEFGNQFKFSFENALSNPECVFKGAKYRITVLTERLVRLEYSKNGTFIDNPSSLVLFRKFDKPQFTVQESNSELIIETNYFKLIYRKEKNFYGGKITPSSSLK